MVERIKHDTFLTKLVNSKKSATIALKGTSTNGDGFRPHEMEITGKLCG